MKQPALIATRILFAVSDDAATDAPTITPMKLVQATASLCEKMHVQRQGVCKEMAS
jgi:hypothetical protein